MCEKENIKREKDCNVPIWEKALLTLDEAAAYFNIGVNKLREITNAPNCPYIIFVGSKRLIKRVLFTNYLAGEYSI